MSEEDLAVLRMECLELALRVLPVPATHKKIVQCARYYEAYLRESIHKPLKVVK